MNDVPIDVRPARAEDLPEAARLAAELVRLHHRWDALRFMLVEPVEEGYLRFMRSLVGRSDVVFLVASRGSSVVGYLLGTLEERNWSDLRDACGKIHDVLVADEARGRGAGTRLMTEALDRFRALGAPRVVLMTAQSNDSALRLFERMGFRRTMVEMTRELF